MSIDIAAENARTVGRDTWSNLKVSGHGDVTVAGFARSISKNVGETMQFSVDGNWRERSTQDVPHGLITPTDRIVTDVL